ncbi:MAG: radical SAM protein [Thermodesulfobacteria bacterium]|nr:radical SAM protein [Thermodesulfobacteriota bacterium]
MSKLKFYILTKAASYDSLGVCKVGNLKLPVLKILFTNFCKNNCKYCINRCQNDVRRARFSPEELASLVINLAKKGIIKGLFLSSGIEVDPDDTMEKMIQTVLILRKKYEFNGYIHLKVLPGSSYELVKSVAPYVDRLSCNLEFVTKSSLLKWAPEKSSLQLVSTLKMLSKIQEEVEKPFSVSTQVIVGASEDTDKRILELAWKLYKNRVISRMYFSAYVPVNEPGAGKRPPYTREYRLYQADMLIRKYGFRPEELFEERENLPQSIDPKLAWAKRHPEFFPVELTKADYYELLRIPGIGPETARKILKLRRNWELSELSLKKIGISLEKLGNFATLRGRPIKKVVQLALKWH